MGNNSYQHLQDHWDFSRPVEQDQSQWNDNAKMWLQMDHIARSVSSYSVSQLHNDPSRTERVALLGSHSTT
jgi:hypothetical protein